MHVCAVLYRSRCAPQCVNCTLGVDNATLSVSQTVMICPYIYKVCVYAYKCVNALHAYLYCMASWHDIINDNVAVKNVTMFGIRTC